MTRKLLIFVLVIAMTIPFATVSAAPERHISGRIYLPDGDVAPAGGLRVTLTGSFRNGNNSTTIDVALPLLIPEDEHYIDYILDIPQNAVRVTISLEVQNASNTDYFVDSYFSVFALEQEDIQDADMHIVGAAHIKGRIILPEGMFDSPDDLYISITATSTPRSFSITYDKEKSFTAFDYVLDVEDKRDYTLKCDVYSASRNISFLTGNNYLSAGGLWSRSQDDLRTISINKQFTAPDFQLAQTPKLSGRASLPKGFFAPKDGLVLGFSVNYGEISTFTIPQGETFVDYTINVPNERNVNVSVSVLNADRIDMPIYTGVAGLHEDSIVPYEDWGCRYKFAVGTEDIPDINFELIPIQRVTGLITIPEPCARDFSVEIHDELHPLIKTTATIKAGETSARYRLETPYLEYDSVYISFESELQAPYVCPYSYNDRIYFEEGAVEYNISLQPNCVLMKGTLSLPEGMTAVSDIKISCSLDRGYRRHNASFVMQKGESSIDYIIYTDTEEYPEYLDEYSLVIDAWGSTLGNKTFYYYGGILTDDIEQQTFIDFENPPAIMDFELPIVDQSYYTVSCGFGWDGPYVSVSSNDVLDKSHVLVAALYNIDDVFVGMETLPLGSDAFDEYNCYVLESEVKGLKVRAFVWDSLENMSPLSNVSQERY